jgi:hypothetical protein
MKTILTLLVLAILAVFIVLPEVAWPQVFTVCRKYNPDKNCYICTDYFSVSSEEEAQARCARRGMDEAFYFPGAGAVAAWKLGNCTCAEERRAP